MGQNMVSWICDKQAVHEVTHFQHQSYPECSNCADEYAARRNESSLDARRVGAVEWGALATTGCAHSGTQEHWSERPTDTTGVGCFWERELANLRVTLGMARTNRRFLGVERPGS